MTELMMWWLSKFPGKQRSRRDGAEVCCPIHGRDGGRERHPSLGVDLGKGGRILLKCQAGCRTEDIVRAVGAEMKDLFEPDSRRSYIPGVPPPKPAKPEVVEEFTWTAEDEAERQRNIAYGVAKGLR